jgi:Homeodomain-like domain
LSAAARVDKVEALISTGISDYEIARRTGISRSTVQRWRTCGAPTTTTKPEAWGPRNRETYSYLLGMYLGDGYIAQASRSSVLEISLDPRYPEIIEACSGAIWETIGVRARRYRKVTPTGESVRVAAASSIWPMAFPQHGPGKKHRRRIELAAWQQEIVDLFPQQFLRGLIHSDGSRVLNRFSVDLPKSGRREYEYPRYFFTNLSDDILGLFCATCDQLGIRWTRSSHKNISVADRHSVAYLDSFVGPKR